MATFDLPNEVNSTSYLGGKDPYSVIIIKVTDGESDSVLNVGDTVTATWIDDTNSNSVETFQAKFVGTLSVIISGQEHVFMVLEDTVNGDIIQTVVGLKVADAPPTIVKTGNSANFTAESFTVCFFHGTLIATPSGERKVEELASGDLVLIGDSGAIPTTWFGRKFARAVSVKWIGRQTVSTLFGPAERLMPVRFAAGSLGGGGKPLLPHSDLTVTADHAMLVDGVLCEAGVLVNGTTITRVPLSEFGETFTVYHVETEAHEIVLANGAPAETFVDNVSRRAFDNYAEFERLHGDPPEMRELSFPRASNARHLPARIKARLGLDPRARRPRRSAS